MSFLLFLVGDFAILINSGMSIKQAIVYNLVSAILAYFGLVVGILAGGSEMGRQFILSITAGLFLYVALADMVRLLICSMFLTTFTSIASAFKRFLYNKISIPDYLLVNLAFN